MVMFKKERNEAVLMFLKAGKTLEETAIEFSLTKERIRQIKRKLEPSISKREWGKGKCVGEWLEKKQETFKEKHGREKWFMDDLERAFSQYFIRKKQNAKKGKWEFTIEKKDIVWNTICPILGIEIDWLAEIRQENSPSLDRIDSTKGYIPGNVELISWRANRIKNDGSLEEHMKIVEHMKKDVPNGCPFAQAARPNTYEDIYV